MAPNPDPNPVPITTAVSPGFTLNPAPVQGGGADASHAATSPIPATGDSNPGPMSTDLSPSFTLQSSHPADPSNAATPIESLTQLSPGMSIISDQGSPMPMIPATGTPTGATPTGIVTAIQSSIAGSNTPISSAMSAASSATTGPSGMLTATDVSPGLTLSSGAGSAGASTASAMGSSAMGTSTMVMMTTATGTSSAIGNSVTTAAVNSGTGGTTSGAVRGPEVANMGAVVGLWVLGVALWRLHRA